MKERRKPDLDLIKTAAREASYTLLETMGFDMDKPHEIQKDVQHLRRSREICELIQNKLIITVIGIVIASTAGAAWVGFTMALEKHPEKPVIRMDNE